VGIIFPKKEENCSVLGILSAKQNNVVLFLGK
jgi:hypothetical protein